LVDRTDVAGPGASPRASQEKNTALDENTVLDKRKIDEFWSSRTQFTDPRLATNYRSDGRLAIDAALVRRHLPKDATILDLGAGTCTLSKELLADVERIVAVEKFPEFLAAAGALPKLSTVCCDVMEFETTEQFDAILLFGVANFLTGEEERQLYARCRRMMRPHGIFIVKHQCGIHADILVDRFSEELGAHYHARYPGLESCTAMLSESFSVEVVDVYPASLNRWPDTHFYAFVCRLPS
jgi:cyclopropane fatty-acyl-phospholipid synthase-like methyltransferase